MYIKILKSKSHVENVKHWEVFEDIIADLTSEKKINQIITELFISGK